MILLSEIVGFGLLFAGGGGLFLLGGLGMAHVQARKLRNYIAVPAVVKQAEVAIKETGDGTMYAPRVQYVYTTRNGPLESDKTLPMESSSSNRSWAEQIAARYHAGMKTQAYVHPTNPAKVFLVHEPSVIPYLIAMFAMLFVSAGIDIAVSRGTPAGWTDARRVLALVALWETVGAISLVHFLRAGGKLGLPQQLLFMFYGGVGLIGLIAWNHLQG